RRSLRRNALSSHHTWQRANRPCSRRSRLALEALEARCLLSTVMNLADDGPGSLRDAIAVTPSGGTVDFRPGMSGTITLNTGELLIDKDLTVAGPGASVITVSGNHASRVFNVAAPFTVVISGLTIAQGSVTGTPANGGGIFNAGTLTVTDSTLSSNYASGSGLAQGHGSGIFNAGTLIVTNSTLSGNRGYPCFGGGIYNSGT